MNTTLRIENMTPEPSGFIKALDTLDAYGAKTDKLKGVKEARAAYQRHTEIRDAGSQAVAGSGALREQTARDYATGTITLDDVRAAATASTLGQDRTSALHSILNSAANLAAAQVVKHLAEYGDGWVTNVLRPLIAKEHENLMADVPWPERILPNHYTSEQMLMYREPAQEAHGIIRQLHNIANNFRQHKIIPAKPGRLTEEYEWRDRIDTRGNAGRSLENYVYQSHAGHGPGIYTEAEVADLGAPQLPTQPTRHFADGARL